MRDLIFLSLENWDEIWRRNQFICAELARRAPRSRILFVGRSLFMPQLARGAASGAGRRAIRGALSRRFWRVPELPNIHVYNPIKTFPNPFPGGRNFNEKTVVTQIRRAAREAGVRDPLLWINPFDSGFLIGKLGERGVVYDITDDWELAAPTPAERERITGLDRDLCRRADLTMVCSQALFQSRRQITPRLLLLPNGVDAAHYARIDEMPAPAPGCFNASGVFEAELPKANQPEMLQNGADAGSVSAPSATHPKSSAIGSSISQWPRPVFGYTGTLHAERIDLDLVLQLARAHPGGSVVLIGPHHWMGDSLALALKNQPNLHAPGSVPYAHIAQAMARFDVCIVPHRRSEFVESLNPIKLWEYLACGKPIVATDVAGFRDFPHLVRLCADAKGFIQACRDALGEISLNSRSSDQTMGANEVVSPCALRRAEAAQHSWGSRVDIMLQKWIEIGLLSGNNRPGGGDLAGFETESARESRAVLDADSGE